MQPSDLALLRSVTDPRLSPDTSLLAFTVARADLEANVYRSAIWLTSTDGSAPARRLTGGLARDACPRWCPDGTTLAFVSHREAAGSQLWLLPLGAGEATQLAASPEEIDDVAWSPDGRWLAYAARQRDEAHYGQAGDGDRPPRRLTTMSWRMDGIGWRSDRPRSLFVVAADGSGPSRLLVAGTSAGDVIGSFAWAPDSLHVAFAQGRHPDADLDRVVDLWTVRIAASGGPAGIAASGGPAGIAASGGPAGIAAAPGEPRRLTGGAYAYHSPVWSADGATIACFRTRPKVSAQNARLCRIDVATGGLAEDPSAASLDRGAPMLSGPALAWDGDEVVFAAEDRGSTVLYRTEAGAACGVAGIARELLGRGSVVTGFDVGRGLVAATIDSVEAGARSVVCRRDGQETAQDITVATFGVPFPVQRPERFEARSADGTLVEAWLVRPAGFDAADGSARCPVLLDIHGGPYAQYGYGLFDEIQVQAGAGYAVLYGNPRGSSGYGEAWGNAIRRSDDGAHSDGDNGDNGDTSRTWGSVDAEDVLAIVDTALARWPFLDAERVGVIGGSYGGYLTSWLISHSDRFAAACSERAVNNVLSMCHTSDIGWWFNVAYAGTEDPAALLACSPVTYAEQIHTPLLIMHSENDWRCPIEQGEDLFRRLRRLGRPVEMVRFPGEGHELSRSGSPRHRLQRFEIQLEFFARYLQTAP